MKPFWSPEPSTGPQALSAHTDPPWRSSGLLVHPPTPPPARLWGWPTSRWGQWMEVIPPQGSLQVQMQFGGDFMKLFYCDLFNVYLFGPDIQFY